jgi:small conductance mechanosensitive channel
MPDLTDPTNQLAAFLRTSGVPLLLAALVALLAFRATRPIVHRAVVGLVERRKGEGEEEQLEADETRKRVETIEDVISKTLRFAVVVLFALVVMTIFDLLPVVAGLGIIVAALTVAGQDVVRDYIMGVLILLEGQYSRGDWIQVAGVEGTVEDIGLRRTVLRDATGTVHSVSNGGIRIASNLTRFFALVIVDVTVAFGTDLEMVTAVVDRVGRDMVGDPEWGPRLLEPPHLIRVGAFTEIGVPLRIGGRVRAADRFTATGELRKRLLVAFQAERIEIPGVQRFMPMTGASPGAGGQGRVAAAASEASPPVPDDLGPSR